LVGKCLCLASIVIQYSFVSVFILVVLFAYLVIAVLGLGVTLVATLGVSWIDRKRVALDEFAARLTFGDLILVHSGVI
jgi:hypothetical protein